MFGFFGNLWASAAHRLSPAWRWRYAFISLLLAFNIGSAAPPPSAQLYQAGANAKFYMSLVNPKTILCTGEEHTYTLVVYHQYFGPDGWTKPSPEDGVKVEAYADPRSIGAFYDAVGNGKGGSVFDETNENFLRPVSVDFVFTAGKKPGKGNLVFQGMVSGYPPNVGYVSLPPFPVSVIPCKYKVKTVIKHLDAAFNITMTTGQALMTGDASGNFTGSATLHYQYSVFSTDCGNVGAQATDSQVTLTGKLDDSGEHFLVTETFGPTTITGENAGCGAGSGTHQVTIDPLTFKVPLAGGVVTQSVAVGTARIVVIPQPQK